MNQIRAVFASLLIVGCIGGSGLPTHRLVGGGPAALMEGRLVEENGCLLIEASSGERYMVVWPLGSTRVGQSIQYFGQRVGDVGDVVELGGGGYNEDAYDNLRNMMNQDLPPACRIGNYWLTLLDLE